VTTRAKTAQDFSKKSKFGEKKKGERWGGESPRVVGKGD